MIRRLLLVAGLPLVVGIAAAVPLGLALGPQQWTFAAIAFGLCVPPGVAVVVLSDYLNRTSPFGRIVAVFAGTLVRMAVGFGGGVVVFLLLQLGERADRVAFWLWVLGAYLTTLVIETAVLARNRESPGTAVPGL